jgi:hypothetical protein
MATAVALAAGALGNAAVAGAHAPTRHRTRDAASTASVLPAGRALAPGHRLLSANRRYVLAMRGDGNLVVYGHGNRPLYASAAKGRHVALVLQNDGNAVVYGPGRRPLWSSKGDGSLLSDGQVLRPRQSRTSPDGAYQLLMQPDGNLVEYATSTRVALWSSQTGRHPGAVAAVQLNGVVTVSMPGGPPLFETGAAGGPTPRLAVQDDGDVVVYAGARTPPWASDADQDHVTAGELLMPGQTRASSGGRFLLAMQGDGNLFLYRGGRSRAAVVDGHAQPGRVRGAADRR